jgi:gamma-glutamylcyclotransferase (GGCT)/AIG2-like uncharacterized protein YtfP
MRRIQSPKKEGKHLVFVYGTLRRGSWNHSLLRTSRYVGKGRTRKRYALYADSVPYVVKGESVTQIAGEVYEVNDSMLKSLDGLERHPDWYERELVAVVLEDGSDVIAWMYFYPKPRGNPVPSGDYFNAETS